MLDFIEWIVKISDKVVASQLKSNQHKTKSLELMNKN